MLSSLSVWTYELPLHEGFAIKAPLRQGVILESPEHKIFAEAAPLPGYSQESYLDVVKELSASLHELIQLSKKPYSPATLRAFFQHFSFSPSTTFALYTLFEQIYAPFHYPLKLFFRHYIDMTYTSSDSCRSLLNALLKCPLSHIVKVKLGSYPVEEAILLLRTLLTKHPLKLHIDLNEQWSLDEALHFATSFKEGSFFCIEDPVASFQDLPVFAKYSPHPISLDHLLRHVPLDDLLKLPHLKNCEFKPTLDMPKLLDPKFLATLREHQISYTFSSCYETSIGLSAIGLLGHRCHATKEHGINTLKVFRQDLLKTPFAQQVVQQDNYFVLNHPHDVNFSLLKLYETASLSYR